MEPEADRGVVPRRRGALRPGVTRPRRSRLTAYVDSSALVASFAREPETERIRRSLAALGPLVSSRLTYVEVQAVLAAARRDRRLTASALSRAQTGFESFWARFLVLDVDEPVARAAVELAERFALRSHDAVQLASALRLQDPSVTLVALDQQLVSAASAAGLQVTG